MRILYILTRGDAIGGASVHVRDLARRLIEDKHEVFVLVGGGSAASGFFSSAGVPFAQISKLRRAIKPLADARALWEVIRHAARFQPDLISCHTAKAGALGRVAARILGCPSIYSPHCWSFAEGICGAKRHLWIERALAPMTDRLVAVSEYERVQGLAYGVCSEANSLTIQNGVQDFPEFLANPRTMPPNIIMVARFDDQKDHATLLYALARLLDLPWFLQLVGEGPAKKRIETLVDQLDLRGRTVFRGYRSDIHQLLQGCQLFVLSSWWESFPRSVLEAMRAGLPVLATDTGGVREAVAPGITGYLVQPGSVRSMYGCLAALLSQPERRARMGLSARSRFEATFSFERMYDAYTKLYQRIL